MQDLLVRRFEDAWKIYRSDLMPKFLELSDPGLLELFLLAIMERTLSKSSPWKRLAIIGASNSQLQRLELALDVEHKTAHCFLPELHTWGVERYANHSLAYRQRLRSMYYLSMMESGVVCFFGARAMGQYMTRTQIYQGACVSITKDQEVELDRVELQLKELGYQLVDQVLEVGDYTKRGGILDFFPAYLDFAVRVEFFGDEISSIRYFDPNTQRSLQVVDIAFIHPMYEFPLDPKNSKQNLQLLYDSLLELDIDKHDRNAILDSFEKGYRLVNHEMFEPVFRGHYKSTGFDLFGDEDLVIYLDEPEQLVEEYKSFYEKLEISYKEDIALKKPSIPVEMHFLEPKFYGNVLFSHRDKSFFLNYSNVSAQDFSPVLSYKARSRLSSEQISLISGLKSRGIEGLEQLILQTDLVVVIVTTSSQHNKKWLDLMQAERIETTVLDLKVGDFLFENKSVLAGRLNLIEGSISDWIYLYEQKLILLPENMILGGRSESKRNQLSRKKLQALISSFRDLVSGSLVVHVEHGVGKYLGMERLDISGIAADFILIEYAGGDKVYVPVDRLNLVQKYSSGGGASNPSLDRLKSQGWVKKKSKASKSIQDLADKLLKLQAERKLAGRIPYDAPNELYYRFEASFPYQETYDQLKAIEDVENDLVSDVSMDRLICGDVGFGKTEVAMRATMRAVLSGYQVMLLAPTTILAFQHFKTFQSRFDEFGISVAVLNRFVPPAAAKLVKENFSQSKVDILIGTHRVLSKDVVAKNLGLVIVDEEQRFGVTHKEAIKELRVGCDILTLTATPIPRSLHMSMLGLRDISVIMSPPAERSPVLTYLSEFDPEVIVSGVEREIKRGGQVYFVHNKVEDIERLQAYLSELLNGITIKVAHGQMKEHQLESVMKDFIEQKFSVLLCTTIIESGLDIPNANTIFINRADMFGLAQLYQMRGRVGRSSRQSFAYLLTQSRLTPKDEARKRLEVLLRHQELGAGFHIANYDLEFRGAGNLLGGEQSGHVAELGLELYTQMLEEQVEKIQSGELQGQRWKQVEIKFDISASIPSEYIPQESRRLELYKSIFSASDQKELELIFSDCSDRYGKPPQICCRVFKLAELKILANVIGLEKIKLQRPHLIEATLQSLKESELTTILKLKDKSLGYLDFDEKFGLKICLSLDSVKLTDDDILDRAVARFSSIVHHIEAIKNDKAELIY